jgi:NADH-quinone oxidoreductase subunit G
VLPVANVAEEDGSFVNRDGRVQRYFQAKAPPGMSRPAWWVLGEILRAMERGDSLDSAAEAFRILAASEPAFGGLSYESLGVAGTMLRPGRPAGASA